MRPSSFVGCAAFPCGDVVHERYRAPDIDVDPARISIILISEVVPPRAGDFYYDGGDSQFERTTVQAFCDAGAEVASMADVVDLGVYLTTAVKCAKTGYGIATSTVRECSRLLEHELAFFPHARVLLLMGDVAIKAVNAIAARQGVPRPIPAGPTYKIRGPEYTYRDLRVFPSYLQAGPSFFIEKSKRRMIAEDIAAALAVVGQATTDHALP